MVDNASGIGRGGVPIGVPSDGRDARRKGSRRRRVDRERVTRKLFDVVIGDCDSELKVGAVDMRLLDFGEWVGSGVPVFAKGDRRWVPVRDFDGDFFVEVYRGACGRCRYAGAVSGIDYFGFVRPGHGAGSKGSASP